MSNNWHELNKRYLLAKIRELNEKLRSYIDNHNFHYAVDQGEKSINYSDVRDKIANKNHHDNNATTISQQAFIESSIDYSGNKSEEKEKEEKEGDNMSKIYNSDFINSSKKNITSETITEDKNFLPSLEILSQIFGLGDFEKNMVLLCAAVELNSETSKLCSMVQDSSNSLIN